MLFLIIEIIKSKKIKILIQDIIYSTLLILQLTVY